ncbi:coiled-coil domain-containing protein 106-like [Megalops cyprinoides]|uniref:coiled-coil domain-containing protein 106-like n=1 Tax=Megalops cyprinoides TaxID=118141 RepID=UPI001864122A|nr:coiled-coil domain-containing protein 106-like [Megalops cyprinoides]
MKLEELRAQLEIERNKNLMLETTMKNLQEDKEFLKQHLGHQVKHVSAVIQRYKAALKYYREGNSMRRAFEKAGIDRNTISRTAQIAELYLARGSRVTNANVGPRHPTQVPQIDLPATDDQDTGVQVQKLYYK